MFNEEHYQTGKMIRHRVYVCGKCGKLVRTAEYILQIKQDETKKIVIKAGPKKIKLKNGGAHGSIPGGFSGGRHGDGNASL